MHFTMFFPPARRSEVHNDNFHDFHFFYDFSGFSVLMTFFKNDFGFDGSRDHDFHVFLQDFQG